MFYKRSLFLILTIGFLLAACGAPSVAPAGSASSDAPVSVNSGTYTNISPAQLAEMLQNKDFFFVNTHVPYEGEITGTGAFIPFDRTAQRLNEYPADKNAKIVLYCRSGRMSAIAAEALMKAGYTNVWNLEGGMIAWEQAGYPLLMK